MKIRISIFLILFLSIQIHFSSAALGTSCTADSTCTTIDAPRCDNDTQSCSYCTSNDDCYHLNKYFCYIPNGVGSGYCLDCAQSTECETYIPTKPYCDRTPVNHVCASCETSEKCCTSDDGCGYIALAQCTVSKGTCGACTKNSSCTHFNDRKYCVKGTCQATFTYDAVSNCATYDTLGYCASCNTNYTLVSNECRQKCTDKANCTDSASYAKCDTATSKGYCVACTHDSQCPHQGLNSCVSGICRECQNSTTCSSPEGYCNTNYYTCANCTNSTHCSSSTLGTMCNLVSGQCQSSCPTLTSTQCDTSYTGCGCSTTSASYQCSSYECKFESSCFHKSQYVKVLRNDNIEDILISDLEAGEMVQTLDPSLSMMQWEQVLIKLNHETSLGQQSLFKFTLKQSNKTLSVTPNHYVFVRRESFSTDEMLHIPSSEVIIGDEFIIQDINSTLLDYDRISKIESGYVDRSELVAVYTGGTRTLLVNGVHASSKSEDDGSELYLDIFQFLATYISPSIPQKVSEIAQYFGVSKLYRNFLNFQTYYAQ